MHLGIDLGTSELKALLLDESGAVEGLVRQPLTVQQPQADASEQDPQAWWLAVQAALDHLHATHGHAMARVRSIGLSGQMHGAVLLDRQHQVLRPAMLWNDGRSAPQCARLMAEQPNWPALASNLAMPGFTAPKLMWVHDHEPRLFEQVALVLLPKDHVRLMLTGEAVTEPSDASGTLWFDIEARRWSPTLLKASGMQGTQMPRLVEGNEPSGLLHAHLAQRWGMPARVVVAGGAGDNAASAVGMGCVQAGEGFVSLGTSGVIFVTRDGHRPNPAGGLHAFCHALPQRWHQMSVMLSAASAIGWATRSLGFANEESFMHEASQTSASERERAPRFLPFLSGERTPYNEPRLSGMWHGMRHDHTRAALAWAVVEGVSWGLAAGWRSFGDQAPARRLSAVGGGARSAWWLQVLADTLSLPLVQHEHSDVGGALGAARLGWLAVGGDVDDVCVRPAMKAHFEPSASGHAMRAARQAGLDALVARELGTLQRGS